MEFQRTQLNDYEDKLNEFSFIDLIKWLRDYAEKISYYKRDSDEYLKATQTIDYLIKRFCKEYSLTYENYKEDEIGRMIFSAKSALSYYHKYDKESTISDFKSDMEEITRRIIGKVENK